jgi:hypothetical protein
MEVLVFVSSGVIIDVVNGNMAASPSLEGISELRRER